MKKLIVWICNGVVGVLSILAIVCYFFAPIWQINVSYPVQAEDVQKMISSDYDNLDIEELIGDGFDVKLSLNVEMDMLFVSLSSDAEATVQKMVDGNVDSVVDQLSTELASITPKVIQSVTEQVVKEEINKQLGDYLSKNSDKNFSDDEITRKREAAGVDDTYISEKTEELFDAIYSGESTVDEIGDMVVETVTDAYEKLSKVDEDFFGAELTDEAKESIKNAVVDVLGDFASDDGTFHSDEILEQVLLELMKLAKENDVLSANVKTLAAASETPSVREELRNEVGKFIKAQLPSEATNAIVLVLRVLLGLILLSALTWLYIIVKLIVKLIKKDENPTVKLKLPIWLGWLPFLVLVCVPSIALGILGSTGLTAPGGALEMLAGIGLSFGSIGWIALMAACICFAISIFYMVMRKQFKNK